MPLETPIGPSESVPHRVMQFATAAAKVHTLRELSTFARIGRSDSRAMASWGLSEAQFFGGLALAINLSFSIGSA